MAEETPKKKPFGFEVSYELFNAREERLREVLLIENPGSGQVMQLGIANALVAENERITLHPLPSADASDYHFRLRFPQGALARRTVGVEGEDWRVSRVDNPDGTTDVLLSWSSPDVTLAPGEWLTLGLKGVSAEPGAGAQVVMALKWPKPETDSATPSALTISPLGPGQGGDYELEAQRPLGTRNRRGRPDCPLRAGFVGAHKVLNVGNEQGTLRLRLSNEAPAGSQDGTLRFVYDANEPTRTSRLVVALPVGTAADAPWALGTEQQVKDITFSTLADWSRSAATLSADGAWMEWTFTPTKEVTLAPRAFLELQLGKLVTLHPDGPARLLVRYENVPGFWDGERVCVIEKAPLVFGQKVDASHDYSGRVGIGNANPTARLYLRNGHLRLHSAEIQSEGSLVFRSDADNTGDNTAVQFFKKNETAALMQLNSNGDLTLTGDVLPSKGSLTVKGRVKDATGWLVPVGTILAYGGPNVPEGWLLCDGSLKSKTTYADLYAAIGDTYSASPGQPMFRLPSLLARVPMGAYVTDTHNYPLGTLGGEFTHTLTMQEMPAHSHSLHDPGHSHDIAAFQEFPMGNRTVAQHTQALEPLIPVSYIHSMHVETKIEMRDSGGGQPHNNLQPYTTVHFIIKY